VQNGIFFVFISLVFSKFDINSKHIHQSQLGNYSWKDLYSYEKIIHFPYNSSTMSIFEQYNAGIPLLFPSLDFTLKLIDSGIGLFSEIVFENKNLNRQPNLFLNKEWLSYSDFYNGTIECEYFDSLNFKNLLKEPKFNNKQKIFNSWRNILLSLQ